MRDHEKTGGLSEAHHRSSHGADQTCRSLRARIPHDETMSGDVARRERNDESQEKNIAWKSVVTCGIDRGSGARCLRLDSNQEVPRRSPWRSLMEDEMRRRGARLLEIKRRGWRWRGKSSNKTESLGWARKGRDSTHAHKNVDRVKTNTSRSPCLALEGRRNSRNCGTRTERARERSRVEEVLPSLGRTRKSDHDERV